MSPPSTISLYFYGAAEDHGEMGGPGRPMIHAHKRAEFCNETIDWPAGAELVEIVVPGVGKVDLRCPAVAGSGGPR